MSAQIHQLEDRNVCAALFSSCGTRSTTCTFSILLPATGLSSQGSAALSNVSSRSTHTNIPSAMAMPRTSMRVTYLQSILIAGSAFKCHASAIMQLKFVAEALFAP